MEVVAEQLSDFHFIPWSAIDEMFAHQAQSMVIMEILLTTPLKMRYLLDNVYRDMKMRLPLAAQRGMLRCYAVAGIPPDW